MSDLVMSADAFTHQGFYAPGVLNHYNEDRLVLGRNVFAVVDGATAVVNVDMNGLNPSAYMAKFLADFLRGASNIADDRTAVELLEAANGAFRAHLQTRWPEVYAMGKLGPSAAVAVVKLHDDGTMTVASAADCQVVVRFKDGSWNTITPTRKGLGMLSGRLYDLVRQELDKGKTLDEVRTSKPVKDLMRQNRLKANVTFGTFNHEPEAVKFFFQQALNLAGVDSIAIFSDGMEWPAAASHERACAYAAESMYVDGVRGYHKTLVERFGMDPNFTEFPRFKHMDDATGILLRLRP